MGHAINLQNSFSLLQNQKLHKEVTHLNLIFTVTFLTTVYSTALTNGLHHNYFKSFDSQGTAPSKFSVSLVRKTRPLNRYALYCGSVPFPASKKHPPSQFYI